jgi:hypothetical protein
MSTPTPNPHDATHDPVRRDAWDEGYAAALAQMPYDQQAADTIKRLMAERGEAVAQVAALREALGRICAFDCRDLGGWAVCNNSCQSCIADAAIHAMTCQAERGEGST